MAAKLGAPTGGKKPARPKKDATPKTEGNMTSAAGQGHNSAALKEERARLLYREGDKIAAAERALEDLKEQMKPHKTVIAQARAAIQKAGFPLEAYDERMKAAKRLKSENIKFEQARDEISEAYALPTSAEVRNLFDGDQAAQEGMDWEAAGFTARLVGAEPKPPVTGTDGQLWLKGWHEANDKAGGEKPQAEAIAEAMAAAEDPAPEDKAAASALIAGAVAECRKFDWGTVGERGEVIVLNRSAFALEDDDGLDQASKVSVNEEVLPFWEAASRVLAFWDGKRRVLKEPGYEDTGEDNTGSPESELSPELGEDAVIALEIEETSPANDGAPAFD